MENKLPNRKPTRLRTFDYNSVGAYFITICTQNKQKILSRIVRTGVLDGPRVELLPCGKIADKYLHQLNDFYDHITVEHYVIMPNHIHILLLVNEDASGPSGTPVPTGLCDTHGPSGTPVPTDLCDVLGPSGTPVPTLQNSTVSRFVSTFKRFCNKKYGENIWQYRSNDHVIRDREDYDRHLKYICENPERWRYDELYTDQ